MSESWTCPVCKLRPTKSKSMCRYPMGVSLWSPITPPAVIPALWREGICHFGCLLPFAFSGAKLSSDLLWSFPRLTQSPCLPSYWKQEMARLEEWPFLGCLLPGPEWRLIKVMSFSAMSSVALHSRPYLISANRCYMKKGPGWGLKALVFVLISLFWSKLCSPLVLSKTYFMSSNQYLHASAANTQLIDFLCININCFFVIKSCRI